MVQHIGPVSATIRDGAAELTYELIGASAGLGVVLMHGGQSGRSQSRVFALALAEACSAAGCPVRVLIMDRRNMGTSAVAFDGAESLPQEEAEDVHALMSALQLGRCILAGSSSGARTCLLLAHCHPADVAALILAPPTGGGATSPTSIPHLCASY